MNVHGLCWTEKQHLHIELLPGIIGGVVHVQWVTGRVEGRRWCQGSGTQQELGGVDSCMLHR